MIVYLAGFSSIQTIWKPPTDDIFLLSSFWEHRSGTVDPYVLRCKHILDSGAFSAMSNPRKHANNDWRDYARRYADFIVQYDQRLFFELDIDSIVGHDEVMILRDIIEQRTGLRAIPVWHKSRGLDEWNRLCERYDYVGIGGFVTEEIPKRDFKYVASFLSIARKNNTRVHGLGFTSTEWLKKLKFYSVDSSTWNVGAKFGNICQWTSKRNMNQLYPSREISPRRVKDRDGLNIANFNAWLQFQKWALVNL